MVVIVIVGRDEINAWHLVGLISLSATFFLAISIAASAPFGIIGGVLIGIASFFFVLVTAFTAVTILDERSKIRHLFHTWEQAAMQSPESRALKYQPEFVGRSKALKSLSSTLDNEDIRVGIISGPPGIGKTRLALEATQNRKKKTLFLISSNKEQTPPPQVLVLYNISFKDLPRYIFRRLKPQKMDVTVILEDPSNETARAFIEKSLDFTGVKLIINLFALKPTTYEHFKENKSVCRIKLNPLEDDEASKLLAAAKTSLDYNIAQWIITQASGYPGTILLAAAYSEMIGQESSDFIKVASRSYEDRVYQAASSNDSTIQKIQLLSMLESTGVQESFASELTSLCDFFGGVLEPNSILTDLPTLEENGILRYNGSFVGVLPYVFANGLAGSAAICRFAQLIKLFRELAPNAATRLIKRLQNIGYDKLNPFWTWLFSAGNEFGDIASALSNSHLLYLVAGGAPRKLIELLQNGLEKMDTESRKQAVANSKTSLTKALGDLLLRIETSHTAAYCLCLLAETEETQNAFAINTLSDFFSPYNFQAPLKLKTRVDILKRFVSAASPVGRQRVGIRVAGHVMQFDAFPPSRVVVMGCNGPPYSVGVLPSVSRPDIASYFVELSDILLEAAESHQLDCAEAALEALPQATVGLAAQAGGLEPAIVRLRTFVGWIVDETLPISVSKVYSALSSIHNSLRDASTQKLEQPPLARDASIDELKRLMNLIDEGSFFTRVKRWANGSTSEDWDLSREGKPLYKADTELCNLAAEAVAKPVLLTHNVIDWLCSTEAERTSVFFRHLGRNDSTCKFLPIIEAVQGERSIEVFAHYFEGMSQRAAEFVFERLNQLSKNPKLTLATSKAEALIAASGLSAQRLTGPLIVEQKLNPAFVADALLSDSSATRFDEVEFCSLLEQISGDHYQNSAIVVEMLDVWMNKRGCLKGKLASFAWGLLEAAPLVKNDELEYYCFDRIASILAKEDVIRGFQLLTTLLTQPSDKHSWNPILYYYYGHQFWEMLKDADRDRALRTLFNAASEGNLDYRITRLDIRMTFDQINDADLLLGYALECERQAVVIASCLSIHKPKFWDIAIQIIEQYPWSQEVRAAFAYYHGDDFGFDPPFEEIQKLVEEIERRQRDPETPEVVLLLLGEFKEYLKSAFLTD